MLEQLEVHGDDGTPVGFESQNTPESAEHKA